MPLNPVVVPAGQMWWWAEGMAVVLILLHVWLRLWRGRRQRRT
jgi:hypothetical protein